MNGDMQILKCSAVYSGDKDANERLSFRFPFLREAHKPSTQSLLRSKQTRVSSLTWRKLRQGFLSRWLSRPDGQDGHTVAETWLESLRRYLALAVRHCGLSHPTEIEHPMPRPNEKKNASSLNGDIASSVRYGSRPETELQIRSRGNASKERKGNRKLQCHHSENCGFPSSFYFRSCNSTMKRTGNAPPFSWGYSLVFHFPCSFCVNH